MARSKLSRCLENFQTEPERAIQLVSINFDVYNLMDAWASDEYTQNREIARALSGAYPECIGYFSTWFDEPLTPPPEKPEEPLVPFQPVKARGEVMNESLRDNINEAIRRAKEKEAKDLEYENSCGEEKYQEWFDIIIAEAYKPPYFEDIEKMEDGYQIGIRATLPSLRETKRVSPQTICSKFNEKYKGRMSIYSSMYGQSFSGVVEWAHFSVYVRNEPELSAHLERAYAEMKRRAEFEEKIEQEKKKAVRLRRERGSAIDRAQENKLRSSLEDRVDDVINRLRQEEWRGDTEKIWTKFSVDFPESQSALDEFRARLEELLKKEFDEVKFTNYVGESVGISVSCAPERIFPKGATKA